METLVYSPLPKDAHTRDTWQVDAEAPELVVDSTGTTLAIMAVTFKGDKDEQKREQLANGRRVVAAVNAFRGLPNEAIEKIDVGDLLVLLQKAQRLVPPGLLPLAERPTEGLWVDIENALKGFRSIGFDHAPYVQPPFERGQRVHVNHPRYHGEGIVRYDTGDRKRMIGVLLGNGNTWEYEAETVTPIGHSWVDPRIQPFDVTERVLGEFTTETIEPNDLQSRYLNESPAQEDTAEMNGKLFGNKGTGDMSINSVTNPNGPGCYGYRFEGDGLEPISMPAALQKLNEQIVIGLGISPKALFTGPDRGLDFTNRAPRIYDKRCDKCGGHTTSDPGYSCTPDLCINQTTVSETA